MIELELVFDEDPAADRGQLWSNTEQTHVISKEDAQYWVRDENGNVGVANDLSTALDLAQAEWGDVTLAPANQLVRDMKANRYDAARFLVEYLADYGAAGIDVQALANLALDGVEN